MRPPDIHTNLLSPVYLTVAGEEVSLIVQRIDKHENLLIQIVSGLGFDKSESNRIMEEVRLQAIRQYDDYTGLFPFKVWLSKILVKKCIFEISQDFFNGLNSVQIKPTVIGNHSTGMSIFGRRREQLSLSLWLVYLLRNSIGFNENEIAEILNTSIINIRERLNKAMQFISRT